MGRLSDRDASIIMVLLVIAIVAFPYVFYIKDAKVETESLKQEYVTLEARYHELQEMDKHREEFLTRTKELNDETDAIVASYPADIVQENYTMFLLNTELNHDLTTANFNETNRKVTWDEACKVLFIDTVSYGENEEVPIQNENVITPYVSVFNESTITYKTYYSGMKDLLAYFIDQQACGLPMCYSAFSAEYDTGTGVITGSFVLDQFAIKNTEDPDRVLEPVEVFPDLDKYDLRGMLYEYGTNGIDGNNGVFGPLVLEDELSEEGEAARDAMDNGTPAAGENAETPQAEETPAAE